MKFFTLVMIMMVFTIFEENPIHDITAAVKPTVNVVWSDSVKVRWDQHDSTIFSKSCLLYISQNCWSH